MSLCRGVPIAFLLAATMAQAQSLALVRTGVWRTIEVPLEEGMGEVTPVPEIHVAPGTATLLVLPVPIAGPGGFTLAGGEGRVRAQLAGQTTIVLLASREVGPERIPLGVQTADGRRYPFLLLTRPGVVDIQVQVAFAQATREEEARREDAIIDGLLRRDRVFSRQYTRPTPASLKKKGEAQWETPFVESAVRMGKRYYIQVGNASAMKGKVEQAKLEGAGGEVLQVLGIYPDMEPGPDSSLAAGDTHVIVAVVPEGAGADYALKSIELVSDVGREARVAVVDQKVSLP